MHTVFPCEIMSWNVLPAVRREMAEYLINEKKMPRKDAAKALGLTEAAVCQYLKKKRGGSYRFTRKNLLKIRKLADRIVKGETGGMCFICRELDSPKKIVREAGKNGKAREVKS